MVTQTAQRSDTAAEIATGKGEIVPFQPPRLPYHSAIEDRFGVDRAGWNALVGAIFPNARTVDAIAMALSYCRARNLDVFKRPVHIVPMWSSAVGAMVETVWPGISELRTTAFRTGQYAGMQEPEFGPTIEQSFTGKATKGRDRGQERSVTLQFPEWCRITIIRELNGKERSFVGPKVYWLEAYAKWADTDVPNDMWQHRGVGQLEKCAEAAALRRTFPEEIGNDYTAEEMEGRSIVEARAAGAEMIDPPEPPPAKTTSEPVATAEADRQFPIDAEPTKTETVDPETGEITWEDERHAPAADVEPPTPDGPAEPPSDPKPPIDTTEDPKSWVPTFLDRKKGAAAKPDAKPDAKPAKKQVQLKEQAAWLDECRMAAEGADSAVALGIQRNRIMDPYRDAVTPQNWATAEMIFEARLEALSRDDDSLDPVQWLRDLDGALSGCEAAEELGDVKAKVLLPAKDKVPEATWKDGVGRYRSKLNSFMTNLDAG